MKLKEERIVNYLKENVGRSISTRRMIKEADAYEGEYAEIDENELIDMHYEILRIAKANGYRMDSSRLNNMLVGLPHALNGVIKRKRAYSKVLPKSRT